MSAVKLQQGDRVSFRDEVGGAIVLRSGRPGHVVIRTDDGFEFERLEKHLVKVEEAERQAHFRFSDHQAGMIAASDMAQRKRSAIRPGKTLKRPDDGGVAEVDLHLHELVEDESSMSHGEKLEFQLRYFERALESAIRDGKRKLIVIHGVGEGVLREEVRRMLQYYDGVQFSDAEMGRYGAGATEVRILRHR
ncbi:MAG: Smr/MutS family protein [Flavobacteriales bacterium]|nr:Smr/MutS family protein [Flavobacteriales bacterium]MCC6937141.1 Smr/MutS family protein [Flavobacteriales bacterium]